MILVGLTGGIGQGKTTVSRMLRGLAGGGPEGDLETSYVIAKVLNAWLETWPAHLKLEPGQDVVDLANALITSLPAAVQQSLGELVKPEQLQIERSVESQQFNHQLIDYLQERLAAASAQTFPTPITPATKSFHRKLFMWLGACLVVKVDSNIWGNAHDRRIKQLAATGQKFVTVGGIRSKYEVEMIHRNGGVVVRVVRPDAQTNSDLTERFMLEVTPDTKLVNNGSFEELEAVVGRLYRDLAAGRLQSGSLNQHNYYAKQS